MIKIQRYIHILEIQILHSKSVILIIIYLILIEFVLLGWKVIKG